MTGDEADDIFDGERGHMSRKDDADIGVATLVCLFLWGDTSNAMSAPLQLD